MLVKAIKLISGEELVGEVLHEEVSESGVLQMVTLKNILAVLISRQPDGNLGVGFVPFAPYLGKNFSLDFNGSNITFIKEVDDEMKNQYSSIFGGVVVPPKHLIVG